MIGRIDLVLRDRAGRTAGDAGRRRRRRGARAGAGGAAPAAGPSWMRSWRSWAESVDAGAAGTDVAFVEARKRERAELIARLEAWRGTFVAAGHRVVLHQPAYPAAAGPAPRPEAGGGHAQAGPAGGRGQPAQGRSRRHRRPPTGPRSWATRAAPSCHKRPWRSGRRTVHARAWKTIVDGGKTGIADCVSCHVTGFGEVGGSSLGHVKRLTNVQCETCHGPGSLHVKAEGLEEPPAVRLRTPESTCTRCHNEKHSDTFQYAAYLRDVLGPGHGAKAREKLGPGPTGRQLRSRAVAAGQGRRQGPAQEDVRRANELQSTDSGAVPASSWSSRSGSMLPPVMTTTTRRLGSGEAAVQQGGQGDGGRGLADQAQGAIGVGHCLADGELADQGDVRAVVLGHAEGALADAALQPLGQRRAAVVADERAALFQRAFHRAVRLGRDARAAGCPGGPAPPPGRRPARRRRPDRPPPRRRAAGPAARAPAGRRCRRSRGRRRTARRRSDRGRRPRAGGPRPRPRRSWRPPPPVEPPGRRWRRACSRASAPTPARWPACRTGGRPRPRPSP